MSMDNFKIFRKGMKDGVPIALGYLAVSFSLGIAAKHAGLSAIQGFLTSVFCLSSTGEYVGFTLIAAGTTYLEIALATLIANARYLLMSCSLSQRMSENCKLRHRIGIAFGVTDEIFGITIARSRYLNPFYTYGAMSVAIPAWSLGTALGVIAGNILPARLVSAFSVALYGMFLAVIIPEAKKDKIVAVLIMIGFAASYFAPYLPVISTWSEGIRTIILTVVISAVAAILFPRATNEEETA